MNLAYRWFCRLELEDGVPDHSAFTRARNERFREATSSATCSSVSCRLACWPVSSGGKGFAVDASLIAADANKCHRGAGDDEWSQISIPKPTAARCRTISMRSTIRLGCGDGRGSRRFVHPQTAAASGRRKAPEARSSHTPQLSHRHRARHCRRCRGHPRHPTIEVGALTDHDRADRSVLRAEARLARCRHGLRLRWKPRLAGGGEKHRPTIPVIDKSKREDGTFSRDDFAYDAEKDLYTCPNGKALRTTGTLQSDNTFRYVSRKADCDACPLKSKCCPKQPQRRVLRDPNEAARDYARALAGTQEFEQSANKGGNRDALWASQNPPPLRSDAAARIIGRQ